ncbi:hypothetical protein HOLleu_09346 [Holothuria leucospilota]|uniref:Uncharacterized protein n=1 Tax=Holothuria leucospilota TaxID=206669 RepID=A0A9Q1HB00_HOLLE|nr:hypothetical protein HOLleu_09346 [Holothuria leucospilota]
MKNKGTVTVDINLAGRTFEHDIHVADIDDDAILGLDFMVKHYCQLDCRKGTIIVDGTVIGLRPRKADGAIFRLKVTETTIIPPGSEAIVPAKIMAKRPGIFLRRSEFGHGGLVSPLSSFLERHDVVVAHALVDVRSSVLPYEYSIPLR